MKHWVNFALVFFLTMASTVSSAADYTNAKSPFDEKPYIAKCGGTIYPACSDQIQQFGAAFNLAKITQRKLLLVVGADWCVWCVKLSGLLEKQIAVVNDKYVVVKLDGDIESAKAISNNYHITIRGYPTVGVIDPTENKFLGTIQPNGSPSEISDLVQSADHLQDQKAIRYPWFPVANLGSDQDKNLVHLTLLQKPIDIDPANIAAVDAELSVKSGNPLAKQYYLQGMFYLFTYNWVDATRSFSAAIKLDSNMMAAYLGLSTTMAYLGSMDSSIGAAQMAQELGTTNSYSMAEMTWLAFMRNSLCIDTPSCRSVGVDAKNIGIIAKDNFALQKQYSAFALKNRATNIVVAMNLFTYGSEKDSSAENMFNQILKIKSDHVGALHLLTHVYESANKYKQAEVVAREALRLSPSSEHIQHMYGHILPKLGRWQEAIEQFLHADQLSLSWMAKNSATPQEDWHYQHNLDLLAHAYNWTKDYAKAESTWTKLCNTFGGGYCQNLGLFQIARGSFAEANRNMILAQQGGTSESVTHKLPQLIALHDGSDSSCRAFLESASRDKSPTILDYEAELLCSIQLSPSQKQKDQLVDYLRSRINQAGFDSWSQGVLAAEVIENLATIYKLDRLAGDIRFTIESVGFVCRAH